MQKKKKTKTNKQTNKFLLGWVYLYMFNMNVQFRKKTILFDFKFRKVINNILCFPDIFEL